MRANGQSPISRRTIQTRTPRSSVGVQTDVGFSQSISEGISIRRDSGRACTTLHTYTDEITRITSIEFPANFPERHSEP